MYPSPGHPIPASHPCEAADGQFPRGGQYVCLGRWAVLGPGAPRVSRGYRRGTSWLLDDDALRTPIVAAGHAPGRGQGCLAPLGAQRPAVEVVNKPFLCV